MYAVIAAVVSAALLVYFTVRIAREPKSSDCVVYIPRWLFFLGLVVYIFGAGVGVAMLADSLFALYAVRLRRHALLPQSEGRVRRGRGVCLFDYVRQGEAAQRLRLCPNDPQFRFAHPEV